MPAYPGRALPRHHPAPPAPVTTPRRPLPAPTSLDPPPEKTVASHSHGRQRLLLLRPGRAPPLAPRLPRGMLRRHGKAGAGSQLLLMAPPLDGSGVLVVHAFRIWRHGWTCLASSLSMKATVAGAAPPPSLLSTTRGGAAQEDPSRQWPISAIVVCSSWLGSWRSGRWPTMKASSRRQ